MSIFNVKILETIYLHYSWKYLHAVNVVNKNYVRGTPHTWRIPCLHSSAHTFDLERWNKCNVRAHVCFNKLQGPIDYGISECSDYYAAQSARWVARLVINCCLKWFDIIVLQKCNSQRTEWSVVRISDTDALPSLVTIVMFSFSLTWFITANVTVIHCSTTAEYCFRQRYQLIYHTYVEITKIKWEINN